MTKSQFLQMAGRAGRAGYDDIGECFVIANQGRERIVSLSRFQYNIVDNLLFFRWR